MCKIVRLADLAMGILTKILQKLQKARNMKKNIYEHTDKNCQYPTDAGWKRARVQRYTKRDYLRDVFRIWLNICKVPFDDADVYSSGGHWYGQTRDRCDNWYDTVITGEYIITCNKNGFDCKKKTK